MSFKLNIPILDRYIYKDFIGPFLLAVGGFVIIGVMDILFTLVDMFINSGVPFWVVTRLLLYKVPAIMVLFFPMAALFSIMLLLVRMAKENELTILRTSGVHMLRVLMPVFILAIFISALSLYINEKIVPWANHVSDNLIQKSIEKTPPPDIAENIFFSDSKDRYFYIKKINAKEGVMNTIMIYEITYGFPRIISAQTARWDNKTWELENGYIQEFSEDGLANYSSKFETFKIHVDKEIQSFYTSQKTTREMDSRELKEQIKSLEKSGINTKNYKVEYYMKLSIPFACLIFMIIGIAFCLWFVKSGKDWWGVIFAVCISVLAVGFYFFLVAVFRSLGRSGMVIPFIGAWMPNIIYGLIGLFLIAYQVFRR